MISFKEVINETQELFSTAKEVEMFLADNASNALEFEELKRVWASFQKKPFLLHDKFVKIAKGKYDSLELRSKTTKEKFLIEFPKYNILHVYKWEEKKWKPYFESYISELF